jgi:hypothetical protein
MGLCGAFGQYFLNFFILFLIIKKCTKTNIFATSSVKNQGGPPNLSPKIQGGPPTLSPPLKSLPPPPKLTYGPDDESNNWAGNGGTWRGPRPNLDTSHVFPMAEGPYLGLSLSLYLSFSGWLCVRGFRVGEFVSRMWHHMITHMLNIFTRCDVVGTWSREYQLSSSSYSSSYSHSHSHSPDDSLFLVFTR